MNIKKSKWVMYLLGVILFNIILLPEALSKKKKTFTIAKLSFTYKIPAFDGGNTASIAGVGGFKKWGSLETTYSSFLTWADDVNFKYYVLLKDAKNKDVLFTGSVTYMNIPKGKGHKSYIYIHPFAIKRYGKVKKFRVEIWHEGVIATEDEWPSLSRKDWWRQIKGISGNLLVKYFTPFNEEALREGQIKMKIE